MSAPACPVPSRWACDELAAELVAERRRRRALAAAEGELAAAEQVYEHAPFPSDEWEQAFDRYLLAIIEHRALRDGAP